MTSIISKTNQPNSIESSLGLYDKIASIIESARQKIATTINLTMVYTYYEIGKYIVEDEQQGAERAAYGKEVLKELAKKLTEKFGKGFSEESLNKMRYFYNTYNPTAISSTLLTESQPVFSTPQFTLSWSHYLILMRIENPAERHFYEIEATNQQWSVRQLSRQFNSSLYERLALSRDKQSVIRLANEGQTLTKPEDILKNPITLEFLGLNKKVCYSESDLENDIISKLQDFLLEMGKGFLFEARQKRFTFNEEHFFVDLVLYNRLLQCYVLVDLKTENLKHQDLGQMQMYVNYYDRYIKMDFEKPTIGIILCKTQNNTLVELTLPTDANIYSSAYSLYLPDKNILQAKLKEWVDEYEAEKQNK